MKKLWLSVLGCLALVFCGMGFVGCQSPQPEVKSVSIESTPTQLTYYVGQDLQLTGGTIKVTYEDDTVKILPMTLATPSITTFKNATNDQIVVLSYKGQTTKFGVHVLKGTLAPVFYSTQTEANKPLVSTSYTSQPVTFDKFLNTASLPNEDITITYLYKSADSSSTEYTLEAPVNAGSYDVKVLFSNSDNYQDLTCECKLNISKSNIKDLVLSGNSLDYDYGQIPTTYGNDFDLANFWTQADGYLGLAPLPENVRLQLEYSYRPASSSNYTTILPNTLTGEFNLSLDVGEYVVRIRIHNNSNINDESIVEFNYIVTKSPLLRGRDFDLYLSDGTNETLLENNTVVAFESDKTYNLVLKSYIGELTLKSGTVFYLGNSTIGSTTASSAGSYRAEFCIEGNNNFQDTGREAIKFVLE